MIISELSNDLCANYSPKIRYKQNMALVIISKNYNYIAYSFSE
ncbi:protein of unknown function [Serratia sp. Tan611]|nr:protein of unknown function [Serratia sp. Tan611]